MNDRIEFFCVHPAHQAPSLVATVTFHDDMWAYCPAGQGEGHDWRHGAEITLDELRRLLHARGTMSADWMRDLEPRRLVLDHDPPLLPEGGSLFALVADAVADQQRQPPCAFPLVDREELCMT
jgi:hypothetical protein